MISFTNGTQLYKDVCQKDLSVNMLHIRKLEIPVRKNWDHRHLIPQADDEGIYQVKNNALYGLSLGVSTEGEAFSWASFSGISTYLEPDWLEPTGNYKFMVYVEDRNEPGSGADHFWIEVYDKDNNVVDVMSIMRPATVYAKPLTEGNIFGPH